MKEKRVFRANPLNLEKERLVSPYVVVCGLHYLMMKSEHYKSSGIQIDKNWIKEIKEMITGVNTTDEPENLQGKEKHDENAEDADSDHFSEVDDTDIHVGNTDTLLDEVEDEETQSMILSMYLLLEKVSVR